MMVAPSDVTPKEFADHAALPFVVLAGVEGESVTAWLAAHRGALDAALTRHGAVVFRGFDVTTPEEFAAFATAASVTGNLMGYVENTSPRTKVLGNVHTSTDYPADRSILLHNEHSYSRVFPRRLFFACMTPPGAGGQTLLADCRRVLARIRATTRAEFAKRGYAYVRNFRGAFGPSWRGVFRTTDRKELDAYCRASDIEHDWLDEERLTIRHVRPAIVTHPETRDEVWFNHAAFWHMSALEPMLRDVLVRELHECDYPNHTYFGDGGRIDPETIAEVSEAYAQECVPFTWQRGDALVLDNILVAHGRAPFVPPRLVLFAMADAFDRRQL